MSVSRLQITYALVLLAIMLTACSSKFDFVSEVIFPKTSIETLTFDGEDFSLVTYRTGDGVNPKPIFYIGGSGCMSLRAYMGTYFAPAPAGLEIISLEKTGVHDRAIGIECSQDFWQGYTYDELLRRNEIALSYILQKFDMKTIPIIGTSEGGAIALELAARTNAAQSLAVIGAGAMPQRQELRMLYGTEVTDSELQRVENNPQSVDERAFGLSNRYWSSVLDRDPKHYAEQISAPTLIIIGEKDQDVPVASARLANDLIRNSKLIVWPNATHTFDTPTGNQRNEVVETAITFLVRGNP